MKNIAEVIRDKEEQIARVKAEVEALRLVAPLLSDSEIDRPNGLLRPQPLPPGK